MGLSGSPEKRTTAAGRHGSQGTVGSSEPKRDHPPSLFGRLFRKSGHQEKDPGYGATASFPLRGRPSRACSSEKVGGLAPERLTVIAAAMEAVFPMVSSAPGANPSSPSAKRRKMRADI